MIETLANGVHTRWLCDYQVGTDQMHIRFDARMSAPFLEPRNNHFDQRYHEWVLQHYEHRIAEIIERALAEPTQQFNFCVAYDHYFMWLEWTIAYGVDD